MKDFMSIGEIVIDFAPFPLEGIENTLFQMNPGGAPANVACVLSRMGNSAGVIAEVGNDIFGQSCIKAIRQCGVDVSNIIVSGEHNTTLTFVCLSENGDRSFFFYRDNTADVSMSVSDLHKIPFEESRIFHFGSVSQTQEPARSATLWAVNKAKKAGSIISYDPNLRLQLWPSEEEARQVVLDSIPLVDILKISEEEGDFLFHSANPKEICRIAVKKYGLKTVILTRAAKGCMCYIAGKLWESKAYDVNTIDTTGSGDAFVGGFLHCLLQNGGEMEHLREEDIIYMMDFANATGSLTSTKKGAIPAIPTIEEVNHCMATVKRL